MKQRIKKASLQALKICVVVALFALLWSKGLISASSIHTGLTNWKLSIPAIAVMIGCSFLGMIRWQWLLQIQGIRLPLGRVIQLALIGNFFNFALPGAVSGDLVKAYYIGKEIPGRRGSAFGSILFDRIVGVSALVIVSALALIGGWSQFSGSTLEHGIRILLVTGLAAVLAFYVYLFVVRDAHDPVVTLLSGPLAKQRGAEAILRVYNGIRTYHSARWAVMQVLALSCVIHFGVVVSSYWFAGSLGELSLQLLPVAVIVPLGLLATAVPVLPGGMGTGHAAFAALFILIGSSKGADIYNLFLIPQLLVCALGGLVYLRFRAELGLPESTSA